MRLPLARSLLRRDRGFAVGTGQREPVLGVQPDGHHERVFRTAVEILDCNEFGTVELRSPIKLDGKIIRRYTRAATSCGRRLIAGVDKWLAKNPRSKPK